MLVQAHKRQQTRVQDLENTNFEVLLLFIQGFNVSWGRFTSEMERVVTFSILRGVDLVVALSLDCRGMQDH